MKTMNIITEGEQDGHGRLLFTATWIDPDNHINRGQVFHARLDEHVRDWQSIGWEVIVNRMEYSLALRRNNSPRPWPHTSGA